jgi:hypothetical protein
LKRVEDALGNWTHRLMVTGRCYDHQPDGGHFARNRRARQFACAPEASCLF